MGTEHRRHRRQRFLWCFPHCFGRLDLDGKAHGLARLVQVVIDAIEPGGTAVPSAAPIPLVRGADMHRGDCLFGLLGVVHHRSHEVLRTQIQILLYLSTVSLTGTLGLLEKLHVRSKLVTKSSRP